MFETIPDDRRLEHVRILYAMLDEPAAAVGGPRTHLASICFNPALLIYAGYQLRSKKQ